MKGSCLCGTIHYECEQLASEIVNCHCRTCQKAHAAAYASTAKVLRKHFRWLKGEDSLSAFESSPGKTRHFCARCGSHLMAERTGQECVIVRIATLDDDPQTTPHLHIWCSHDVPWLQEKEQQPHYQEWQPER